MCIKSDVVQVGACELMRDNLAVSFLSISFFSSGLLAHGVFLHVILLILKEQSQIRVV